MGATALETNPHLVPKGEEPGLEMTTALPEDVKTNDVGVPVYMGRFTGTKLITAITYVPALLRPGARAAVVVHQLILHLRLQCNCDTRLLALRLRPRRDGWSHHWRRIHRYFPGL